MENLPYNTPFIKERKASFMKAYRYISTCLVIGWFILLFLHSYYVFTPMDLKIGRDEDMHLFASCRFYRNVIESKKEISNYINERIHHPPLLYITSLPFHLALRDATQKAAQWAILLALLFGIVTSVYLAKVLDSPDSAIFALILFSIALVHYDEMGHFAPYIGAAAFVSLIIALAIRSRNFELPSFTALTFFIAGIGFLYYYALPLYLLFPLAIFAVSGLLRRPKATALNLALGAVIFVAIALIYLIPMGFIGWLKGWIFPTIKGSGESLAQTIQRASTTFLKYIGILLTRAPELVPIYALPIFALFFRNSRMKAVFIIAVSLLTLFILSFSKIVIVTDARFTPFLLLLFTFTLSLPTPSSIKRAAVIVSLIICIPHMNKALSDLKEYALFCHNQSSLIWTLKRLHNEPNALLAGNIYPSILDRLVCESKLDFNVEKQYLTYLWGETAMADKINDVDYVYLSCLNDKACDWFDLHELIEGFSLTVERYEAEKLALKVMSAERNYKKLISMSYELFCKPTRTETILINTRNKAHNPMD